MNDWFVWNGTNCTDMGMHMLTPPSIIVAQERVEDLEIPGRSGTLTRREGDNIYNNLNLTATCIIDDMYDEDGSDMIARIGRWLKGNGEVTFHNRANGHYKARIANQIPFDKVLRNHPHRIFSVEFISDPFFYLTSGLEELSFGSSGGVIFNDGTIPSLPLIKVYGSGDGMIMIGNNTMLVDDLDTVDYLMIDCDAKIAYTGERGNASDPLQLKGTMVSGEWLEIPENSAYVTLSGGITRIEITPRWRCV